VKIVIRLARGAVCLLAVFAAYGWLDLLRHLPGPHLPLVLPLRANGGGDDISLLTIVVVFSLTFAAIARVAPPRPSRRTRAALVRGALLAAFVFTVQALQQGIVEQTQPTFEWGSALSLTWPWLAAACAVLGTLVAAPRERPRVVTVPPVRSEPSPSTSAAEERPLEASAV
jgi:hypothetical protein